MTDPKIFPEIVAAHDSLTAIRRDIHAHPELGFEEQRTSAIVAEKLKEWGLEVTTGIGKTGVVGTLRVGNDTRSIGLRADMDALPIPEANTFGHVSNNPGVMHACGHDGHTTMLLGAAQYLSQTRNFEGCVHFIFQPAEEGIGGAKAMVEDGLFDQFPCDAVYGMHNRPGAPKGLIGMRPGAAMAGGALFDITVHGKGSHGARPESGIDPTIIAAHIATASQTIVSRNVDPQQMAVLSITQINAGDAYNVIPHTAYMKGTARTFSNEVMSQLQENLTNIAKGVAMGMGAEVDVDFRVVFPPLINNDDEIQFAGDVAADLVGEENVNRMNSRINASEDFSYMSNVVPGAYVTIGQGTGDDGWACEVHNPHYDFNDEIIPIGSSYFAKLVETRLAKES
jgi:amidohydrolase